jgi:hypothetical protein
MYRLDINISSDTTIEFNGVVILQKSKKQFLINDIDVYVYKYYYDIDGQRDEEAFIFVNHLYGIVGINYFPWGLSVFPEGDNTLDGFKTLLFKAENKSFYEW